MKRGDLKKIIEQAYYEVLQEQSMLKTGSEEILQRFPTLRKTLEDLLTDNYNEFVEQVKWVSPKPSSFEIVLKNGERFFLKWNGGGFNAEIGGKNYDISNVQGFQRALSALGEVFQTGAIRSLSDLEAEEEEDIDDNDTGDIFGDEPDLPDEGPEDEIDDEPEPEPDFEEI